MPFRTQQVALIGLAVFVLGGLALLALKVNSEEQVEVDETALAKARAEHRRARAKSATRAPLPKAADAPRASAARGAPQPRDDTRAMFKKRTPPGIPQPASMARAKGITLSRSNEELVVAMDEANKLYDRGDYMGAVEAAEEILAKQPNNVRVLRIAVSAHCILGNQDQATSLWERLPERDQRQMERRCNRYGIEFE